jgi:hypothetical protein
MSLARTGEKKMMTAIEVGTAMLAAKQHPMTAEQTKLFMQMTFMDRDFNAEPKEGLGLAFKIIQKRLNAHNVEVETRVKLFISTLCNTPAVAVMYCAAIKALYERNGKKKVTFNDFTDGFAMGFPSDESMLEIWDRQKVYDGQWPDNWLDRAASWQ